MMYMETKKEQFANGILGRLYGGLNMSWRNVILFAVGAAVLTAILLIVPVFKDTSFELVGVTFEAWIFFAVIIMANCKKPLESAFKTFVFFLISQPLIYLLQVPFSVMGWGILRYYYNWILWTVLTFPMAFVGWFIKKRNWLSVLIFAPVFAYLGIFAYINGTEAVKNFPHYILACLFCLMQIIVYILAFFPDIRQKLVGLLIPIAAVAVIILFPQQLEYGSTSKLPDAPPFSEEAEITAEDSSIATVEFWDLEEGLIFIRATGYGTTTITVTDGGETFKYSLEIYDEDGAVQTRITPIL